MSSLTGMQIKELEQALKNGDQHPNEKTQQTLHRIAHAIRNGTEIAGWGYEDHGYGHGTLIYQEGEIHVVYRLRWVEDP